MHIDGLLELHDLAKQRARTYPKQRFLYSALAERQGRRFAGIVGPRGAGKTILLRQYALAHEDAFYLSADALDHDDDPWQLLRVLHEHHGFTTFLLDEIHFLRNATGLLKRVYDFLPVRVLFSSSVALSMHASAHDLSRRVQLLPLYPFSFREYIWFKTGVELPRLTLEAIIDRKWEPEHLRSGYRFADYLRGDVLPYALEEPDALQILRDTVETVVARDISSVSRLPMDELETIRRLLRFVGRAGVDGINYSSLGRNLGITKYKAEQYVGYLEQAFVLHRVLPEGTNVLHEPKILMALPCRLLYRDLDDAIGGLREDFCVSALRQAGLRFQYLKSTRGRKTPDFLIQGQDDKLVVEVGGKGKGREQFKGIQVDRKVIFAHQEVPDSKRLPLFLLGYLA